MMKPKTMGDWVVCIVVMMIMMMLVPVVSADIEGEQENIDCHIDSHAVMTSKWKDPWFSDGYWTNDKIYINDMKRVLGGPMNLYNLEMWYNNYELIDSFDLINDPICAGEIINDFRENSPLFYFYYGYSRSDGLSGGDTVPYTINNDDMALKIAKQPEGDWVGSTEYNDHLNGYWGRGYSVDEFTQAIEGGELGPPPEEWFDHRHLTSEKLFPYQIKRIGNDLGWKHSPLPLMNIYLGADVVSDDYTNDFYDAFIRVCKAGTFVGYKGGAPTSMQRHYFSAAYAAGIFVQKRSFYESFDYAQKMCYQLNDGKTLNPRAIFAQMSGAVSPTGYARYCSILRDVKVPYFAPAGCYGGVWEGTAQVLNFHRDYTWNTNGAYITIDGGLVSTVNYPPGMCLGNGNQQYQDLSYSGDVTVEIKYKKYVHGIGGYMWTSVDDPW